MNSNSVAGETMKAIFAAIDRTVEILVAAIFAGMVLIGFFQVFSRFVLNATPSWSEEIQIFGHIWLVFLAIPIAYRRGAHFTVEAIRRQYSLGMHKVFDLMVELLWAGFAITTAYYSYRVSLVAGRNVSPGLEIPMSYPYYGMIIGSVYLLLRRSPPHRAASRRRSPAGADGIMITFLLTLLLGTMLVGIPILLCIALIGFIGIAMLPELVMPLFAQKMFGAARIPSRLLAMPYFILAGSIMTAGGISKQLVDFARALVGHFRAGLAHASVVASMAVAGVSGSSTADAAAIGSIVIPTMKQTGYKAGFAAALIATAGTIGAIIPPSMTMVIYGAIAQVSIGGLFLGGIIPGILVGIALMITVKLYTYHPNYPELRASHRALRSVRLVALRALGMVRAAGAADHRRRHPVGHLHRDRGRRHRLRLCVHHRLLRRAQDQARGSWRRSSWIPRSRPRWCPASSRSPARWAGSCPTCSSTISRSRS